MPKQEWTNATLYLATPIGKYPQVSLERAMIGRTKGVRIYLYEAKGVDGISFTLTKVQASMLVRRLKQCIGEQ